MLSFFHAIILGVVEGITEFLPISSTGHLIVAAKLLGVPNSEFLKNFEIFVQLGAILAVVVLYAKRLVVNRQRLAKLIAAFVPTAAVGLVLYALVKQYFLGNVALVAWSLIVGGLILIIFEYWYGRKNKPEQSLEYLTYRHAMLIGLFQTLAIVPGVSRAAATIIGALWLGYKREAAVEFSFLLAVPTMLAATTLDLYKSGGTITSDQFGLLGVGSTVAFFVALGSVLWLLKFIKTHTFTNFGIYRIIAGIIFLLVI